MKGEHLGGSESKNTRIWNNREIFSKFEKRIWQRK